tara:strand:- start:2124 stop:3350 length:1227 start_codon:yes stop_codon:yes gene_type:complete
MKVIHLSNSNGGGAGGAAYRIHKSLVEIGFNSEMWVNVSKTKDDTVKSSTNIFKKYLMFVRRNAKKPLMMFLKTKNPILHSPSFLSSSWVKKINSSDADIVNLHWVQHEMLSVSDISKINKPLVWTLHDMWGFCGAEHVSWDERWKDGYNIDNRPMHESGFDLNRWTWLRKKKYWKKPIQIITSSNWLMGCVKQSKLMQNWPSKTIPNAIDTEFWKPLNKQSARNTFNLPQNGFILAFGSANAIEEPHKGFDLLLEALQKIQRENLIELRLVIFGQKKPQKNLPLDMPIHNLGYLDDAKLKELYSAVDAVVVPSRQDNFPSVAVEAQACGAPVISFNIGGLPDIIEHQNTGYIAKAFNTKDLANGISWVLENSEIKKLGHNAKKHVVDNFKSNLVAKKYLETYKEVFK